MPIFFALAVAAIAFPDPFIAQPAVLAAVLLPFIATSMSLHYRMSLAFFLCWVVYSGMYSLGFSEYPFEKVPSLAASVLVGLNVSWILVAVLFYEFCRFKNLERALGIFCLSNAVVSILRYLQIGDAIGVTNIISLNAAFTATLLPFTFKRPVWFLVGAISILIQPGVIAIGLLGVYTGVLLIDILKLRRWRYVFIPVILLVFFFCLSITNGDFGAGGRLPMYRLAYDSRALFGSDWVGTGVGSVFIFGGLLQHSASLLTGEYWPALHNDFLQLLLESGWIGLMLGLWCCMDALYHAYNRSIEWFLSMLGVTLFAALYYPAKVPIVAFTYGAMIFSLLRKR